MSADRKNGKEAFLSRWSRVKTAARDKVVAPAGSPAVEAPSHTAPEAPAPVLPRLDELTIDSDFSGFFHSAVDEDLRRSALRKLFSDPHFNVTDGLDVYVDDYSKTEPIPAAMLAGLKQAQRILEWASETEEAAEARRAAFAAGEPSANDIAALPADVGDVSPAGPGEGQAGDASRACSMTAPPVAKAPSELAPAQASDLKVTE